jgi:hypothetical protein
MGESKYMKNKIFWLLVSAILAPAIFGQEYKLEKSEIFMPQKEKKILLFSKNPQSRKIVLFNSKLAVNTDGTPKSYHPEDLEGARIALNNICNAIVVRKIKPGGADARLKCAEAKVVFRKFQTDNWVVPPGFAITWNKVIAARKEKPCIFEENEFKGYFGSLTSVKNSLIGEERGECEYKNQLNALEIPNLVLPAKTWKDKNNVIHQNPLWTFKVEKEDLVFAYNPENDVWSYAIIGDGGPPENLGEGSIALNMKLLNKTEFPRNYKEAKEIDTKSKKMLVAVIPNSNSYKTAKPFTRENIEKRGKELLKELGFSDERNFIKFLKNQHRRF